MSESESKSPFSYLEPYSVTEKAMFDMALIFIDSEVMGSLAMTCDGTGLTGITLTRYTPTMVEIQNDEPITGSVPFSAEYVSNAIRMTARKTGVSLSDLRDDDE